MEEPVNRRSVPEEAAGSAGSLAGDPATRDAASLALRALAAADFAGRIARRDTTLWRDDPAEIADRLGWLDLPRTMPAHGEALRAFAAELHDRGVADLVLLGMGGSSLAPEVFRRTFGSAPGQPRLHVLDTTSPDWIRRVTGAVSPASLHVLVASKSGSTIEVRTLFAHFEDFVKQSGEALPGKHFTAITDPGTGLEELARSHGFARVFTNPPDLGGRYSALSLFGLVPAAALGSDGGALLERADAMARRCAPEVPPEENPGLVLGALLGSAANAGRDKLTIVTSRPIESFGLWIEQLIAESTGKDGTGVVPVDAEPWVDPVRYGKDRLFVAVVLGEDGAVLGRARSLTEAGHPVFTIRLEDRLDLGAEMFRWEYATSVCGRLLGVHPFDQPNVEAAKKKARTILDALGRGEAIPPIPEADPVPSLAAVAPGEMVGLMVYGEPRPELEAALAEMRSTIVEVRGVATTLGFGPRFLHSTGQLHKGGPPRALYVQLVLDEEPLPIPGEGIGFEQLIAAQAAGDYLALVDSGKRVVRASPGRNPAGTVRETAKRLRSARR